MDDKPPSEDIVAEALDQLDTSGDIAGEDVAVFF